jgi:hypothetical protein
LDLLSCHLPWQLLLSARGGQSSLKSNGDEALSGEFLLKSDGDEALTMFFYKK